MLYYLSNFIETNTVYMNCGFGFTTTPIIITIYLLIPLCNHIICIEPMLWKDNEQFETVFQLLSQVLSCSNAIKRSEMCIGEAEIKMEEISWDINRIIDRLVNGTLHIGIVGLTKAGKSTFLNALLGKSFLPSSIQPQTASEVVIVHDMSKPEGELYCHSATKKARTHLASGQRDIFDKLKKLNDEKRDKDKAEAATVQCDKLVLNAPLQFLTESEIKDVKLELSDTPGFGEAEAKNIAKDVNLAVKEMCAFVLIISSNNMRTASELKLLKDLIYYHPQLFYKLNRVLILVNVHGNIYAEGKLLNSASISPEEVPSYVSEYLKPPEFLNTEIPPERILIFNALWALRSREWKDPRVLIGDENAEIQYQDALQMLRYFNKSEEAKKLQSEISEENINITISYLDSFSEIENVENVLRTMVVENGQAVLLESAVDDMGSLIEQSLIPFIKDLMIAENIKEKEEDLRSHQDLDQKFNDILQTTNFVEKFNSSIASSTWTQISTLRDTVQESLKNFVSSKLMDGLRDVSKDREKVIAKIHSICNAVYSAALAKMKNESFTLFVTIRNAAANQVKTALLESKASLISFLNEINEAKDSSLSSFVESLRCEIPALLANASNSVESLDSDLHSQTIDKLSGSETFQNANTFVRESKKVETRYSLEKECTRTGLLWMWKNCHYLPQKYDYQVAVYSSNDTALLSAFDSVIQSWMSLYDDQINLSDISALTEEASRAKLFDILEEPRQKVFEALQTSQHALEKSKQTVLFLEERKEELQILKKALRVSIK